MGTCIGHLMNVVFVVNQALWKDTAEWNVFHSYLITRDGADPIPSIVTVIRLMGENAWDPLTNGKDWNLTGNNWKINLLEMFTFKETWRLFFLSSELITGRIPAAKTQAMLVKQFPYSWSNWSVHVLRFSLNACVYNLELVAVIFLSANT